MVAHYVFCLGSKGAFRVVTFPGLNTYAFDLMIGPQVGPIGRFGRLTFLTDMARVGVTFVVLFHMGPVNLITLDYRIKDMEQIVDMVLLFPRN